MRKTSSYLTGSEIGFYHVVLRPRSVIRTSHGTSLIDEGGLQKLLRLTDSQDPQFALRKLTSFICASFPQLPKTIFLHSEVKVNRKVLGLYRARKGSTPHVSHTPD